MSSIKKKPKVTVFSSVKNKIKKVFKKEDGTKVTYSPTKNEDIPNN